MNAIDGRFVRLREFDPARQEDEIAFIDKLWHADGGVCRWLGVQRSIPREAITAVLLTDVLSTLVIETRDGTPIGFVTAFKPDVDHLRFVYLGVALLPEYRSTFWPMEAIAIFVEHLFAAFPTLVKLKIETTEFNGDQFVKHSTHGLLDFEGRAKREAIWVGDDGIPREYAIDTLALWRTSWTTDTGRVIPGWFDSKLRAFWIRMTQPRKAGT